MKKLGRFIRPIAYSDEASTQRCACNLVNDSDMSGNSGAAHLRGNDLEHMWLTKRDPVNPQLIFDFGSVVRLGQMYVWNFNQADGYESGLKNVKIEYSFNGIDYSEFNGKGSPYVFAKANGKPNLKATNLDKTGEPIEFEGLSARFIKLCPIGKAGEGGTWGKYIEGQNRFGLSAVRFYEYRVEPAKGQYAYATALNKCQNVVTSEYGLEGGNHCTCPQSMFLSETNPSCLDMVFDLGLAATMSGVKIYNYNEPKNLDAGIKTFSLFSSLDGNNWTEILHNYELLKASGKADYSGVNISFDTVYAKFFKLTVCGGVLRGVHGTSNGFEFHYGLSKIKFKYADSGYYFEAARDWTALLSSYNGWGGADGIFAAPLAGVERVDENKKADFKTLLLFSDSFVGEANPITKARKCGFFVNNSFGYLTGTDPETLKIELVYGENESMTPTNILNNDNAWTYWMQDCAVIGNKFYVFTDNVVTDNNPDLPEGFKFHLIGTDLLCFDIVNDRLVYSSQRSLSTPLFVGDPLKPTYFGCGVLVNTKENGMKNGDGYVYVYGMRTIDGFDKDLLVARVLPENIENFEQYRFFDGNGWSADINNSAAICNELSPEMSVTPIDDGKNKGKYLYTYSQKGVGEKIMLRVGDTPYGKFSEAHEIFYIGDIEDLDKRALPKVYQYNAKAHYQLAAKNEALITFNVNTMDYESHLVSADVYRPRFVRGKEY